MKRFASALVAIFGMGVLGSFVLLIPQKNVSAQGGGPIVTIGSPLPLPVKDAVSPVTQSCSFVVTVGSFPGSEQARCQMPEVSAGMELVVDSASAQFMTTDPNTLPTDIQFTSTVGGNSYTLDLPYPLSVFPGAGAFPFGQTVRTYADPVTAVVCMINVWGATRVSLSSGTCSIAGHLVAAH